MLHSVILAGGSGTRFWPRSRRDRPKQFLQLAGKRTLLQQTIDRLAGLSAGVVIVTRKGLAHGVSEQAPDAELLVEPCARDTAAAIGLAAATIGAKDPEAILLITPADHVVRPVSSFQLALREAAELAQAPGRIVTFGIKPTSAHTGYGYIERGDPLEHEGGLAAFRVEGFTEKPDLQTAERYLSGGRHVWNSGVFVASAKTLMAELSQHLPAHAAALQRIAHAPADERDAVLAAQYPALEKISIDYGVMERASDVCVLEADYAWSDVGSWAAIPSLHSADDEGNTVLNAPFVSIDARDCLVQGDGRLIGLIGVEGLVVVQTRDATLICPKDRAEEVKGLVQQLDEQGLGDYA